MMRFTVDTLRCGYQSSGCVDRAQVFAADGLDGALSSLFWSFCLCFVASCCLFFILSFLPPLSPIPFPLSRAVGPHALRV